MTESPKREKAEGLLSRRGEEQECTPDIIKLAVINSSAVFTDEGIVVIDVPIGNKAGREVYPLPGMLPALASAAGQHSGRA
jgi:hypothetical protein